MRLRAAIKYAGGLALAAVLMGWVLRDTDRRTLWVQFSDASALGLLAAAALNVSHNVFRAWRWRALLEPIRPHVPFRPMFDAIILGYATSWVIPGRLGEVVRPALLSGREAIPFGACLGSVLADRLLDGLAVLGLFGVGIALLPLEAGSEQHAALIRAGALALVAAIAIPILTLVVASRWRERFEQALADRPGFRGWFGRTLLALAEGLEALKRPGLVARIAAHTVAAWLFIAAGTWVGVRACGVHVPFAAILILLPLLVLGIALPTPGGAGGYHAAMRVGLVQLFGVSEPLAVGAALLQHAVVVLPIVVLGGLIVMVDRIPLEDLTGAARQMRQMGAIRTPGPSPTRAPAPPVEKPS